LYYDYNKRSNEEVSLMAAAKKTKKIGLAQLKKVQTRIQTAEKALGDAKSDLLKLQKNIRVQGDIDKAPFTYRPAR